MMHDNKIFSVLSLKVKTSGLSLRNCIPGTTLKSIFGIAGSLNLALHFFKCAFPKIRFVWRYRNTDFMGQNADPQWLEEARTRDHKTLR